MSPPSTVHLVVPDGIDDPTRPSGGNTYDRRLRQGLVAGGWFVHTQTVAGTWPWAGRAARRTLREALEGIPDGSLVLIDGLVASAAPELVVPASRRLVLVVLMHMPIGAGADDAGSRLRERAALGAVTAVVATSDWSRQWLITEYRLDPARVHVARPGVDVGPPAGFRPDGGSLLCVGAVTPGKGHDVLVAALAEVADRPWQCLCVGTVTLAPDFVGQLTRSILHSGLDGRVVLAGTRTGCDLDATYAAADVLVLPSRGETYGMVVTEALARGLPVLASDVGGVPEALGVTAAGSRPGLLTPPGDVGALAGALGRWLDDAAVRRDLRAAARQRRTALTGWTETADRVSRVLEKVAA